MRRWLSLLIASLSSSAWSVAARAQVNVEPLRQQVEEQGFGARLRASATSFAGNTQGVIFGSSGLVGVHGARNLGYLVLTGDYARLNGVVSVAKWFGHARHNYELSALVSWEEYAQVESDRFRRVTLRELVGTGPRYGLLLLDESLEVYYGLSYLLEHTDLDTAAGDEETEGFAHRLSTYVALTLRAQERITLSHVTYVQPRIDRPRDVTLLSTSSADFLITKLLHSRLDVTLRYDSVKPVDVEAADLEIKNSLELAF